MECNETLMSAYLDEELDPSAMASFARHLEGCATCTRTLRDLQHLKTVVQSDAVSYAAPSHLRYRIQADLDAQKTRRSPDKKFAWNWINAGLTGACSIALAVSVAMFMAIPGANEIVNQEIVASHYRSLLANHMADVISSDHHTVKPWFTGKLDYAPVVQDFAAAGFPLVGGRLDYIDKRTVAALAYRHNNHLINVFMWPTSSNKAEKLSSIQGFNLLQWTDSGMYYSAVSDMNGQELKELRALILRRPEK